MMQENQTVRPSPVAFLSPWLRAFRLHFVLPSVLPAILGAVIAWSQGQTVTPLSLLMVVVGVALNHIGLNMIDDVFDYLHVIDGGETSFEKNPFTGGSGVLTEGLLTVRQMTTAACLCFGVTIVTGLYLTYVCGVLVLLFGIFGMASSILYTMPPIKFGYRGWGEVAHLVNFGPVIVLGSYVVQTGRLSWEPFWASLVPGFMMWSMILINEVPDYDTDRAGVKNNLVVRLGRETARTLYIGGLFLAYLVPICGALLQILPVYSLLALSSLPLAWKSVRILKDHLYDPPGLAPANLAMIQAHALSGSALLIAYLVEGLYPFTG
jgi:1,4-dihydroxy-2-naphthoate octaprenyltransferase